MFKDTQHGIWHSAFNLCANSLSTTAKWLDPIWPGGMDYVKINVILFCIVLPILFAASLGLNIAFLIGWL
jgi:hypothetical protein